jgi:coatomer protein complex subunit epsilon
LEQSLEQQKNDAETLAAFVVAAGIQSKKGSAAADELWTCVVSLPLRPVLNGLMSPLDRRLQTTHPTHLLVVDVAQKADLFDEAVAKFTVPSLAVPAAA